MFKLTARPRLRLNLGREGEKNHLEIEFPLLAAWRAEFGEGTVALIAQRNGDAESYPVALLSDEGDTAIWTVTEVDTASAGFGRVELQYYAGDTLLKSEAWDTFVDKSLSPTGDPPDAYESWMERLIAAGYASAISNPVRTVPQELTADEQAQARANIGAADAKAVGDALAEKAPKMLRVTVDLDSGRATHQPHEIASHIKAGGDVRYVDDAMLEYSLVDTSDTSSRFFRDNVGEMGVSRNTVIIDEDGTIRTFQTKATIPQTADDVGAIPAPATAEVGQTIVVSEVDENGKPIAWEVADMASGGGGETWELIADITLEEAVSYINVEANGKYKGIYVGMFIPANAEQTSNYSFGVTLEQLDKPYGKNDNSAMFNGFIAYNKNMSAIIVIKKLGNKFVHSVSKNSNNNITGISAPYYYSPIVGVSSLHSPIWGQSETLETLTGTCCLATQSGKQLPVGSHFEVYGVRA